MKELAQQFVAEASRVLIDREKELELVFCCLLAGGHLLLEDTPGVGKTTLVRLVARLLGFDFKRVQFTNDLLPADILGGYVLDGSGGAFRFHRGPIFAQLVLGDELNRASPRTQSATLQAMEEREVTIEGQNHPLPEPFFFVGTQNPRDHVGTSALPESQVDRFLMRVELGLPARGTQRKLLIREKLRTGVSGDLVGELNPLCSAADFLNHQRRVGQIHVSEPVLDYVLDLVEACHHQGWPVSPRAGIGLQRAAQARALLAGREHVLPDDVQEVFVPVFSHRIAFFGKNPTDSHEGGTMAAEVLAKVRVR